MSADEETRKDRPWMVTSRPLPPHSSADDTTAIGPSASKLVFVAAELSASTSTADITLPVTSGACASSPIPFTICAHGVSKFVVLVVSTTIEPRRNRMVGHVPERSTTDD